MKSGAAAAKRDAQNLQQLIARNAELERQVEALTRQLDWFKRQLFGRKSEKRLLVYTSVQPLLDGLESPVQEAPVAPAREQISYERRKGKQRDADCVSEEGLRFDDSVPVVTIEVPAPELEGPEAQDYEVLAHKTTHRLAQRPGSYVVLKYVRPVLKHKDTAKMVSVAMPGGLWSGSIADVSLVAGLLEEKFVYYLPLYRQHQRLKNNGITVSREVLTSWVHRAVELLRPIYEAQLRHILQSKILAMDETPIRAGADGKGQMRRAWLWPIYGDADEVAFTYSPDRGRAHVLKSLGNFSGTLLCDGYSAYAHYVKVNPAVTYAQCWSHTRRHFERAQAIEPTAVEEALAFIGELYDIEADIRARKLSGEAKRDYRLAHARPVLEEFFAWCDVQRQRIELLPSNPLSKALAYTWERSGPLRVYLTDPDLQIDTNHLERAIRPIALGRKNWNFCWTEIGAERVGIIQSLVSTCRLHGIHPYTYLVDVLQRVGSHPMREVEQLTPRQWKELFSADPLRSDLDRVRQ